MKRFAVAVVGSSSRTAAVLLLLLSLAIWTALPFRSLSLARQSILTFGWDAASHTLVALDLADSMRGFDIVSVLKIILSQHWWPPFYGLLLSPVLLFLGRSLDNASLVSCLAYIAMPATAWLLIQRIAPSTTPPLWGLCAVSLLFLRSPMLLEMSTWSMLELLGGLLALLGWLAFAHRGDPRYARAAYLLGTSLFFTKYHYGFFFVATLFVFTLLEERPHARRRLWLALRPYLISKTVRICGCTALFFIVVRVIVERQGFQKAEIVYLPTVPNVLYALLAIGVASCLYKRSYITPIWDACPPRVRDFCYCTIVPIIVWLLIPANLRAWYRQTFQASERRAGFVDQIYAAYSFIRHDYLFTAPALLFIAVGLGLAIVTCRKQKMVCGMVAYSLWPILLMSLNRYPLEARFLACLFPTMIVASVCGWVQVLGDRRFKGARLVAWMMLGIMAVVYRFEDTQWHQIMWERARYRYPYPKEETEFVASMIAGSNGGSPIIISLPDDVWVSPTIRLGLRLGHKDLPPREIIVEKKPLEELLSKNERVGARGIVMGCENSAKNLEVLSRVFAAKGLRLSPGPKLPSSKSPGREMLFAKL